MERWQPLPGFDLRLPVPPARSDCNCASVSNIPVTINCRSWHSFRVSCSITRADSASCLSATPASSRVSRSRGQPAMTDAAIGGIGLPEFGMGTFGGRASLPGPAGCGCPAAPRSRTRSRRLRPPAFAVPVDGAIGGTERAGFEFTPAEPIAAASADCVPGADGETASSADAPDAATIATRQAPRARRCPAAVIRASTRHGRRARARDSCWPLPRRRGSRSRGRTSTDHRDHAVSMQPGRPIIRVGRNHLCNEECALSRRGGPRRSSSGLL